MARYLRGRRPPRRQCRECGHYVYAWTEAPLCPSCVSKVGVEAGWTREARRQETYDRLEGDTFSKHVRYLELEQQTIDGHTQLRVIE